MTLIERKLEARFTLLEPKLLCRHIMQADPQGLALRALLALHSQTGLSFYLQIADETAQGLLAQYPEPLSLNAPACTALANVLFDLHSRTGNSTYRQAIDSLYPLVRAQAEQDGENTAVDSPFFHWQAFYIQYETTYHLRMNYMDIYRRYKAACPQAMERVKAAPAAAAVFTATLADTLARMDEQIYYEYHALRTLHKQLLDALLPLLPADALYSRGLLSASMARLSRLELLPPRYEALGRRYADDALAAYAPEHTDKPGDDRAAALLYACALYAGH